RARGRQRDPRAPDGAAELGAVVAPRQVAVVAAQEAPHVVEVRLVDGDVPVLERPVARVLALAVLEPAAGLLRRLERAVSLLPTVVPVGHGLVWPVSGRGDGHDAAAAADA